MYKRARLTFISIALLLGLVAFAQSEPDWLQQTAKAKDVAVSHDGKAWFVGVDGRAYTKNGETWKAFGKLNNLVRIDAGSKGVVAIDKSGAAYIANNGGQWKSLNVQARDVGIGANTIWLAGKSNVSKGAFNTTGNIKWQSIEGVLKYIDVDPAGRAWGVDDAGRTFVHDGAAWIEDTQAPKASDIGIGGNDTIFIVGADIDQKQGGGRVYKRSGSTGAWSAVPGRLSAVSVTQDGKAFGANSLNWLIAATEKGAQDETLLTENKAVENKPTETAAGELPSDIYTVEGNTTLADIVGSNVPGASSVKLTKVEVTENSIAGTATIKGSPVRAVLHQPSFPEPVFIGGLEHASVDLASYIPQIKRLNLGSFGLSNAVFYLQPEGAAAVEYQDFASMPVPLSNLIVKQKDMEGLFPLTVHPGVTVIGTYNKSAPSAGSDEVQPTQEEKDERHQLFKHAQTVLSAYGVNEKTAFVVKGNFKLSQLRNLSFDLPDGGSSNESSQTTPSKKDACIALTGADATGLDLSFPISSFKPPYVKGAVKFKNAKFSLKEIDGKLEPSILTMMDLKFPNIKAGIEAGGKRLIGEGIDATKKDASGAIDDAKKAAMSDIQTVSMAGKLSVKGSLNELCNGLDKNTQGTVSFAGSTAFNLADVSKASFDALSRVTGTSIITPSKQKEATAESAGKSTEKPAESAVKDLGWKNPFGIPFLTINEFAAAGTFEQAGEGEQLKRTMKSSIWTKSKADRAVLDVFGSMDLDVKADKVEPTDWLLKSKGIISFNDLPGLKDMPKLDEFAVKDIVLTPNEMTGGVLRASGNAPLDASIYFKMAENKPSQLFVKFATLKPNTLYDFIPPAVADVALAPAIIGWSQEETTELLYANASAKLKPLLKGLIAEDGGLTVAKGLTLGGLTTPQAIFGGKVTGLFDEVVTINGGIGMFGAFSQAEDGQMRGEMRGTLGGLSISKIPASLLTFENSELLVSNLDGNVLEIATTASVKVPETTNPVKMTGTLSYEQPSLTEEALSLALTSTNAWGNVFKIPRLDVKSLGFDAKFTKENTNNSQSIAFTGRGEFIGEPGSVSVAVEGEDSALSAAVVTFVSDKKEGFNIGDVMEKAFLPTGTSNIANAKINTLMLSTNAVAAHMAFNIGGMNFSGRGAIITDKDHADHAALFLRSDQELKIGKMAAGIPAPMSELAIPRGLVIISPKEASGFNAGGIADAIYDYVLAGLLEKEKSKSLLVSDGVTFMTKVRPAILPLPSKVKDVLKTPFGLDPDNEVYIAGSVGGVFNGGEKSLGFHTVLTGITPTLPPFVDNLVALKNADVMVFVNSKQAATAAVDVGIAVDATIKPRRLDDLSVQALPGTFALTYTVDPTETAIAASATVKGDWVDPLGLQGYSFKDPSIEFGIAGTGTKIGIHTSHGKIPGKNNASKEFVFDLDTTWVGGAPTNLAVQFEKATKADLVLQPIDLVRLQKAFFDLAFRSGSKLKDGILVALNQLPPPPAPLNTLKKQAPGIINGVSKAIESASSGMFTLVENSPLSMIGVKNPTIYFGTPGSTPPSNPAIDRPPLGLGLHVAGAFRIDLGGALTKDVASGVYKVNLKDGYYFDGKVRPPAPFASNEFTASGNMPLLGGPQFLKFDGKLEALGFSLADGTFKMTRGSILSPSASVAADVKVLGGIGRSGTMSVTPTSITFNSPGGCTSLPPVGISGSLTPTNLHKDIPSIVASVFRPENLIPNPIDCAVDLAGAVADVAEGTFKAVTNPGETAEAVAGEVVAVFTDPEAALNNVANVAEMPLNAADALAGAGISLVKMGVEKIPVLGPGAGIVIGETFAQASALKDAAVGALKNNVVTGFLTDSFGAGAKAVMGALGDAGGAVVKFFGGGKSEPPTWWRVNPLRCVAGVHYWNQIFTQCFENGAMVLFDNASRGTNAMGDCMQTSAVGNRFHQGAVKVSACTGDGRNQFHLNSVTDQIRAVNGVYNGYSQSYYGPDYAGCLARRASDDGTFKQGEVYIAECAEDDVNQKWNFTNEMKLKNAGACVRRNASNQLEMGACEGANQWLGTSVVPNWNLAENVPLRGKIMHKATGKTLYWVQPYGWGTGKTDHDKYLLKTDEEIKPANGSPTDINAHVRLRVLDDENRVSIMGAEAWGGWQIYGCVGLVSNTGRDDVMTRHCWADNVYEEAKWAVQAVNANGTLDVSGHRTLIDILNNGDYVFKNIKNNRCLAPAKDNHHLNQTEDCTNGNNVVKANVKFKGYTPDRVAASTLERAAAKERAAIYAARYKALPNLKKWQRYRVRAENARIDQVYKIASVANHSTNPYTRKSPGQCPHGEFWSQALKACAQDSRMLLNYHEANGQYKGCLREDAANYYGAKLTTHCQTANEYDAVVDSVALSIDVDGHIIKKNADYLITAEARDKDGNVLTKEEANAMKKRNEKVEYFISGTKKITKGDSCLVPNRSVRKINGKVALDFMTCSDSSMKWRYSSQGELISENNLCARNEAYETKVYSKENVNKVTSMAKRGTQAYEDLKKQYPFYIKSTVENLVLSDCATDPMDAGKLRWKPIVSNNYAAHQGLPETAKLSLVTTNTSAPMCVTGDMFLNGKVTVEACSSANKNQYFAFGGTDDTRFLISSRNSKTCLYDAGNNQVSHRICAGSGAEMFMKAPSETNAHKIISALSGNCLGSKDGNLVQVPCNNAPSFVMDVVESVEKISFQGTNQLKPNQARTAAAQQVWNKSKHRATLLYTGTYLASGNKILEKGDDDLAYMRTPATVTLEKLPAYIAPITNQRVYIPAVTVPKTQIMLLPGFDSKASNYVTFAHAKPVIGAGGVVIRDHTSDPYASHYPDWFLWTHQQKVMRVAEGGAIRFDYIDESDAFRKSASFKMVAVKDNVNGLYTFESVSNPGQFLNIDKNRLILGENRAGIAIEGATKWMKNDDIGEVDKIPRKAKPLHPNWKFPDTPTSVLNTH